ncbi:replication initiation protein [Spirosoma horti]
MDKFQLRYVRSWFIFVDMARGHKTQTLIYQGNTLTTARYEMSALQKDILYVLQSAIKSNDAADQEYILRVRDIIIDLDRDPSNGYTNLKKASWGMMDIKMEMFINGEYVQVVPFSRFIYNEGEGTMRVTIDPIMRGMLTNLKGGNYTTLGKESAMKVTGKYSKRLYEMISQWKDIGIFSITITELRSRLALVDTETGKELYSMIGMFMERVIDPSINEINQHTELLVRYELIKQGRKYTGLRFKISKNSIEQELFLPTPTDSIGILSEKLVSRFGLRTDQRDTVIEKYDQKLINKKIYEIEKMISDGQIKNIGAYTAKVFGVK